MASSTMHPCFTFSEADLLFEVSVNAKGLPSIFDRLLDDRWQCAADAGRFRFVFDSKSPILRLPGKYGLYLQANDGRHNTRRSPPLFSSTRQTPEPHHFHFCRVPSGELLFRVASQHQLTGEDGLAVASQHQSSGEDGLAVASHHQSSGDDEVAVTSQHQSGGENGLAVTSQHQSEGEHDADWLLINVSPVGVSHVLLVPRMQRRLPQRLDVRGLSRMIDLVLLSNDCSLRAIYNSLGALASVNHYHMQLYRFSRRLYIESATVQRLTGDLYCLVDYPAPAIVLEVTKQNYCTAADRVFRLTELILDLGLAFNMLVCRGQACSPPPASSAASSSPGQPPVESYTSLRVFVWPREPEFPPVERLKYQVASCEMAGHFTAYSCAALETDTEADLVRELRQVVVEPFRRLKETLLGATEAVENVK